MATLILKCVGEVGQENVNLLVTDVSLEPQGDCSVLRVDCIRYKFTESVPIANCKSPAELPLPDRRVQHQKTKNRRRHHFSLLHLGYADPSIVFSRIQNQVQFIARMIVCHLHMCD